MSWVSVDERPPPYGKWVTVITAGRAGDSIIPEERPYQGPAFRSHTDQSGDHYSTQYDITSDSTKLRNRVLWWYEITEAPPNG